MNYSSVSKFTSILVACRLITFVTLHSLTPLNIIAIFYVIMFHQPVWIILPSKPNVFLHSTSTTPNLDAAPAKSHTLTTSSRTTQLTPYLTTAMSTPSKKFSLPFVTTPLFLPPSRSKSNSRVPTPPFPPYNSCIAST